MVLGRFYLKQTQNGNLLGEFSNYRMNQIITESANLVPDGKSNKNNFEGRYRSSWLEREDSTFSNLEIQLIANTQLYRITWRNNIENTIFHGQGFIVDNILIGDYMDNDLRNHLQTNTDVFNIV